MHVSLQSVKTAEIREGSIRSSDDLYYIHSMGGRGDRKAARASVIVEYLPLYHYIRNGTAPPSRKSVLVMQLCQSNLCLYCAHSTHLEGF